MAWNSYIGAFGSSSGAQISCSRACINSSGQRLQSLEAPEALFFSRGLAFSPSGATTLPHINYACVLLKTVYLHFTVCIWYFATVFLIWESYLVNCVIFALFMMCKKCALCIKSKKSVNCLVYVKCGICLKWVKGKSCRMLKCVKCVNPLKVTIMMTTESVQNLTPNPRICLFQPLQTCLKLWLCIFVFLSMGMMCGIWVCIWYFGEIIWNLGQYIWYLWQVVTNLIFSYKVVKHLS